MKEDFGVYSLLKLKNKDEMVSGGNGNSVSFWDTRTFKKEHTVECCKYSLNGLIELSNHCIAVNAVDDSAIYVIDTEEYQQIRQTRYEGYIGSGSGNLYSSLHVLSNGIHLFS